MAMGGDSEGKGGGMRWLGVNNNDIIRRCEALAPGAAEAVVHANVVVPWCKRQMRRHEAAVLYVLASGCNRPDAEILDIGTAYGYSAAVMAQAAPLARITTITPKTEEYAKAFGYLSGEFHNVFPLQAYSADHLAAYQGPALDLLVVDGDHTADGIRRDFGWLRWLKPGSWVFFHDYSPKGAERQCPPVKEAVDELAAAIGRPFDVLVTDERHNSIVAWRQKEGEEWPTIAPRPK